MLICRAWIKKNSDEAHIRQSAAAPVREEALRRSEILAKELQLQEVKWDCGWSNAHFIGSIQSLQTLVRDHPELMEALKGIYLWQPMLFLSLIMFERKIL
jgi:hypothetical protein